MQEVFYRLARWPIRAKYNSKRHYFSLLKITVRQAIAAYWRRRHSQRNDASRRKFVSDLNADQAKRFQFEGKSENLLKRLELKEMVQLVLSRVATLEDSHRKMFRLRFIEQKSHEEIAQILGISTRTSYRLETRLRQKLLDLLAK